MNKELNLFEILKDVPKGTKLYSPLFGEVRFDRLDGPGVVDFPVITLDTQSFERNFCIDGTYCGKNNFPDAECVLFPSKNQRDWSKFEVPVQKVKVTLHPFDKVLVRDWKGEKWSCSLFSHLNTESEYIYVTTSCHSKHCIPYNRDTKHLVGTDEKCPINYEIEFKK